MSLKKFIAVIVSAVTFGTACFGVHLADSGSFFNANAYSENQVISINLPVNTTTTTVAVGSDLSSQEFAYSDVKTVQTVKQVQPIEILEDETESETKTGTMLISGVKTYSVGSYYNYSSGSEKIEFEYTSEGDVGEPWEYCEFEVQKNNSYYNNYYDIVVEEGVIKWSGGSYGGYNYVIVKVPAQYSATGNDEEYTIEVYVAQLTTTTTTTTTIPYVEYVSPSSTTVEVGDTISIKPVLNGYGRNDYLISNYEVDYYNVSDSDIISFDKSSMEITALSPGKAYLTVNFKNKYSYYYSYNNKTTFYVYVTVEDNSTTTSTTTTTTTTPTTTTWATTTTTTTTATKPDIKPTIIPDSVKLNIGDTSELLLINVPDGVNVKWTSGDTSIVKVSDGIVTAVSEGNATVYAVCGNDVMTCNITVVSGNSPNLVAGDANGDGQVTLADAVLVLQYIANPNKYPITGQALEVADVYNKGDGITGMDALAIQKYDSGIIKSLPES